MNSVNGFVRLASLRNDLQFLYTDPDRCPHRLRVIQTMEWSTVPSTLGSFGEQIVIPGKQHPLKVYDLLRFSSPLRVTPAPSAP